MSIYQPALDAAVEVLCRQIMGPRSNMGNVGIRNATRFRDELRAILDAYQDACVVQDGHELDALPVGSVILDDDDHVWIKRSIGYWPGTVWISDSSRCMETGSAHLFPVRVLHIPVAPTTTTAAR